MIRDPWRCSTRLPIDKRPFPGIDCLNSAVESPGWHRSTGSGTSVSALSRSLSLSKGRRRDVDWPITGSETRAFRHAQ